MVYSHVSGLEELEKEDIAKETQRKRDEIMDPE
jgi:hypothetical protein